MENLLWLLCVVFLIQGVTSQITLEESGSGIVKPGESLDLVCKVTGASLTDSSNMYGVSWIRQDDRKQLLWLGQIYYHGSTAYASSIQGRLTLTRDTNKGEVYCKITGMRPEESGTYYCAKRPITGYAFDLWGKGTLVTVTSEQLITPKVFPLIPYNQQGNIKGGCLVLRYFPEPVNVGFSTTAGETVSGGQDFQFPLSGSPLSYSRVSLISVSSTEWESKTYRCEVVHYSSTIQKTIPKGCLTPPSAPAVQLLQDSCHGSTNDKVDLSCLATNLTSAEARITWFLNDQQINPGQEKVELGKSQWYSLQSNIAINLADWNRGSRVRCQVTDSKTGKSTLKTTRKCTDNYNCLGVDVIMVPPTIEDLYVGKIAPVTCLVVNLKKATGFTIEWTSPNLPGKDVKEEDVLLHNNGTYSKASIITVSADAWLQYQEFTCIFKMSGLSEDIIRRISKKREAKLLPPIVSVYSPSPEELSRKELCSVTCTASGFSPKDIYMAWKKNDYDMSKDQYFNSKVELQGGDGSPRFYMTSVARIPCSEWEEESSFTCLVGHEANPLIFTRRTIDKHSGKASNINVTVKLSDTTLSCS